MNFSINSMGFLPWVMESARGEIHRWLVLWPVRVRKASGIRGCNRGKVVWMPTIVSFLLMGWQTITLRAC
jgi:hypothetical protein